MEPDGPESTARVDSSDSDSSSESSPAEQNAAQNVISPSGVGVYESAQSTQRASGAGTDRGQSLADVVRSPILARKSVDIWKKYHKKRRVKKAIIERNGAFFRAWSIQFLINKSYEQLKNLIKIKN